MISNEVSVRRVHGIPVKSRLRGDALGLATGNRNDEQIGVRADGFHFVGDGSEADFLRIRREIDVSWTAALVRRNVVIRSGREIARRTAAVRGNHKQMTAFAVIPVRPVAVEKSVSPRRFHLAFLFFPLALTVSILVFSVTGNGGRE